MKIEIDITELKAVLTIIEVCSNRGAFKAEELSIVGGLYDRLARLVPEPAEDDGQLELNFNENE